MALTSQDPSVDPRYLAVRHDFRGGGWGLGAMGEEMWHFSPLPSLIRGLTSALPAPSDEQIRLMALRSGRDEVELRAEIYAPLLTTEEANARFGLGGKLQFDAPVSATTAGILRDMKLEELRRQDVLRRAERGIVPGAARFGVGLFVSMLDPINVASAFIPVVGEARFAMMVGRVGLTGARAAKGAIEGLVGAAAVEPIVLLQARREQADYDELDSLLNLTFGTIMGGGLHVGAGFVGDRFARARGNDSLAARIADAPLETKDAALRGAVAAVAEGRPVKVDAILPPRVPIIEADPADLPGSIAGFAADIQAGGAAGVRPGMSRMLTAGEVPQAVADRIAAEHPDLDVHGFHLTFQSDEVRHALKRHGVGGTALTPDQVPVTPADIGRVPDIIATADELRRESTPQGAPSIVFTKREGETLVVIEEVRAGKKRLAFRSMRKFRRGGGGGPDPIDAPPGVPDVPQSIRPEVETPPGPGSADVNMALADAARNTDPKTLQPDEAAVVNQVETRTAEAVEPRPEPIADQVKAAEAELAETLTLVRLSGADETALADVRAADELLTRAEAEARGFEAAAICLTKG